MKTFIVIFLSLVSSAFGISDNYSSYIYTLETPLGEKAYMKEEIKLFKNSRAEEYFYTSLKKGTLQYWKYIRHDFCSNDPLVSCSKLIKSENILSFEEVFSKEEQSYITNSLLPYFIHFTKIAGALLFYYILNFRKKYIAKKILFTTIALSLFEIIMSLLHVHTFFYRDILVHIIYYVSLGFFYLFLIIYFCLQGKR